MHEIAAMALLMGTGTVYAICAGLFALGVGGIALVERFVGGGK